MKSLRFFIIFLVNIAGVTAQNSYYLNRPDGRTIEFPSSMVEKVTARHLYTSFPIAEYNGFSLQYAKDSLKVMSTFLGDNRFIVEAESIKWVGNSYPTKVQKFPTYTTYTSASGRYTIRSTKGNAMTGISGGQYVEIDGSADATLPFIASGSSFRITPVFVPTQFLPSLIIAKPYTTNRIPLATDSLIKISASEVTTGPTSDWLPSDDNQTISFINAAFDTLLTNNKYSKNFLLDYLIVELKDPIPVEQSGLLLPDLIQKDPSISIFSEALKLTGLDKKLTKYLDNSYHIGSDTISIGIYYPSMWNNRVTDYPDVRNFSYTAFIEKDEVYKSYGIESVQDLIQKLMSKSGTFKQYDPNGRIKYDAAYTDSNNVLYRFVAYHLLNFLGNYENLTARRWIQTNQAEFNYLDPQEFYETMCPSTVMKFQSDKDGKLFINRRRVNESALANRLASNPFAVAEVGAEVVSPTEANIDSRNALNGVFHYVKKLLIYNDTTALDVLNTRMRIEASTLSPDFLTSGARGKTKTNANQSIVALFKHGYVTNFNFSNESKLGLRSDPNWSPAYQCDALDVVGQYDFTFKIPPVPEGTYEIRIGTTSSPDRGIVQFYFDEEAVGMPVDLRLSKYDPAIGAVEDTGDPEVDLANDLLMYNKGFMKGPDSWYCGTEKTTSHRTQYNCIRVVLTRKELKEDVIHHIRVKCLTDNPNAIFSFDYLELCPASVYDSPDGEDRH